MAFTITYGAVWPDRNCGRKEEPHSFKIVGGRPAVAKEFPWIRDAAYVMSTRSSGSSNVRERQPRWELSRLLVILDGMLGEQLPQPAPPPPLEENR
ncbi:trypsin delta-like [Ixodes scapularis]